MNFKGKNVIVTGASSGIGKALAQYFSNNGANVTLAARSIDKLNEIVASMPSALAVRCDVTKQDDCKAMIEQSVERFGGVDILINNAGLSMRAIFDDVDLDVLHRLMDVNFWGAVYCTKYALPYIQRSRGSIVGISSVAGFHGLPGRTGYSASKYALNGFLETIRIENLYKGVHVMVVAPGFTESNVRFAALTSDGSQQGASPRDEGKMMTANEAAEIIAKAIKKRKRTLLMDFDGKATVFIKKFSGALLDKLYFSHMAKEPNSPFKKQ